MNTKKKMLVSILLALNLSPLTASAFPVPVETLKDGGLGNGTDLYRCDQNGETTYELLDLFEAKLRKQSVQLPADATAEEVLQTLANRHAKLDPYRSAEIFAEATKVLSDIRALARGQRPNSPVVAAAEGALQPGPDAGRETHPDHCVPMRLIEQATDVDARGIRYRIDLDLAEKVGERALGVSAYHEGLYKIILRQGIRSSVGVRSLTGLVVSHETAKLPLDQYLTELAATGIQNYRVGDAELSTNLAESKLVAYDFEGRFQAVVRNPVEKFGLNFTRIEFQIRSPDFTRLADAKKREMHAVTGEFPEFVKTSHKSPSEAAWRKTSGTNTLQVGPPRSTRFLDESLRSGDRVVTLDSQDRVTFGGLSVESMGSDLKSALSRYSACWRNRLLRKNVGASDVRIFETSFNRLMDGIEIDVSELNSDLNECRTVAIPKGTGYDDHPQGDAIEALRRVLATYPAKGFAVQALGNLADQSETCDVRRILASGGFGIGFSLSFARFICHDYAGMSRNFIGSGPGVGMLFGGAVRREQMSIGVTSSGKNKRLKVLSGEPEMGANLLGYEAGPTEIDVEKKGAGLEVGVAFHSMIGVRVGSVRDENLFLNLVVDHMNAAIGKRERVFRTH